MQTKETRRQRGSNKKPESAARSEPQGAPCTEGTGHGPQAELRPVRGPLFPLCPATPAPSDNGSPDFLRPSPKHQAGCQAVCAATGWRQGLPGSHQGGRIIGHSATRPPQMAQTGLFMGTHNPCGQRRGLPGDSDSGGNTSVTVTTQAATGPAEQQKD